MNDFVKRSLSGRVVSGIGQGAGFTRLDWVRHQFVEQCGIEPFPGTLNLHLESASDLAVWAQMRADPTLRFKSPSATTCDAAVIHIRINSQVSGAIVIPDIADYPHDQIEIVSAIGLREHISLQDGDGLELASTGSPPVETVIFDVDGTLLNSLDGYQLAASRATQAYGYTVTLEHVRRALDTNQPFWDFVIPPGREKDAKLIAELRRETMRHWPDALQEVVGVIPGIEQVLIQMRAAGIQLAIFTGSGGESLPALEAANLMDYFDCVITGNDISARKPDPEGIQLCLDKLGLPPDRVAYVGDSCVDITASLAAGVMPVGVLTGAGNSASLHAAGAHRVLPSAAALSGLLAAGA